MPKVSIVFTSYNHREYLKKALESLLMQTFVDFELIIIDDFSTDGSQEILRYYESDPRVKLYLLEKNTGSYVHSSNLGASKATADYIIFAQCDDYAESTQLEKLYIKMINNPVVSVVFSSSTMVDEDNKNIGNDFDYREKKFKRKCASDTLISSKEMCRFLLSSCVIPNLSAALIKRSVFEKLGALSSDYFVLADWAFWLRAALDCDFYYIREPLNNFRQHNKTIRASIKIERQIDEIFRMYYNFFKLSKTGGIQKLYWEYNIVSIWYGYFWSAKIPWLQSVFPLLGRSVRYCFYFPLVFLVYSLFYPFKKIVQKIFY